MELNEKQLINIVSESVKKVLSELDSRQQREARIKPGSQEEKYILHDYELNQDSSPQRCYAIAKRIGNGCSKEAVETVFRRYGILPKYASTKNMFFTK